MDAHSGAVIISMLGGISSTPKTFLRFSKNLSMLKFLQTVSPKESTNQSGMFTVYLILSLLIQQVVTGGLMIGVMMDPDTGESSICMQSK